MIKIYIFSFFNIKQHQTTEMRLKTNVSHHWKYIKLVLTVLTTMPMTGSLVWGQILSALYLRWMERLRRINPKVYSIILLVTMMKRISSILLNNFSQSLVIEWRQCHSFLRILPAPPLYAVCNTNQHCNWKSRELPQHLWGTGFY